VRPTLLNYKKRRRKSYLQFEKGELVGVNGRTDKPAKNIVILEKLANAYAIGRDTHVGDTIIGIKEELVLKLLLPNHHQSTPFIRETHPGKWQQYWKEQLGNWYGMLFHEGQFLDPVMRI
jgi:argininosuccinate synthase